MSGADAGGFPHARRAVDFSIDFPAHADSTVTDRLRQRLGLYLDRFSSGNYSSLSLAERADLAEQLHQLSATLEQKKSSFAANSSAEEYEWALHGVTVALQLSHMFEVSPPPARSIPPDAYRAVSARNGAMSENVEWALEREGPKGRLLVFAHNMHVMNAPLKGGPWNAFREPPSSMGEFLRSAFGRDLLIIGAAARSAEKGFPPMEPDPASIDAVLAKVAIPSFVLDLRPAANDSPIYAWLSEQRSLHANIGTHVVTSPAAAFDAIVYFDTLKPTGSTP